MKKYLIILFVCVAFASCRNETTKATEFEIGTTNYKKWYLIPNFV